MNHKIFRFLRTAAVVLTACLLAILAELPVSAASSGSCGNNLKWTLEDGELKITGSGVMTDFPEGTMAPWYESREQITSVSIGDGVTSIGDLAFYHCTQLRSISLPDSVTSIGNLAFSGCTKLERVTLQEGLKSIGENAFYGCASLSSIRLPDSLTTLSFQAFYRCSSLASIRVPVGVTNFETSVFAYCDSLLQAVIECPLAALPDWTFYGCSSLVNLVVPATMQEMGEYATHNCDALGNPTKVDGSIGDVVSSKSESTTKNEDGTTVETDREVVETGNASLDMKTEHTTDSDEYDVTIDVTVDNADGWEEILDKIGAYVDTAERLEGGTSTLNSVDVHVNMGYSTEVPESVLTELAGKKVNLYISAGDDLEWMINCENLSESDATKDYELRFEVTKNEKPSEKIVDMLGGDAEIFDIKFESTILYEVAVSVPFGMNYAGMYATLCQKPVMKDWEILQSVIIDNEGCATFYLASLDKQTSYMIAVNAKGVTNEDALIPDSMTGEYDGLTDENGNKYVVTGTKSSWGITFWQLTLILIGVIVVSLVVVGLIMRMWFKAQAKRQKMIESGEYILKKKNKKVKKTKKAKK